MAPSFALSAPRAAAARLIYRPIGAASANRALSIYNPAAPHQRHQSLASSSSPISSTSSPTPLSHQTRRTFITSTSPTMAPIPSTMKAVQIAKTGGIDVLDYADIAVPTPTATQVLIKNHYAGVNYIDTYFRTGLYKAPSLPMILGREAAGEIVAVGNSVDPALNLKTGDHVVFMDSGGYAQYTAVEAVKVVSVPDGLDAQTAAAAFLQGLTALTIVKEGAAVQAGQWTLVHAAAGGVGSLLVQILSHLGAKVIATASSAEKLALAKKNGATETVNSDDDLVAKVKEITGGRGVNAIFDGVGKATFEADLQMVAMNGYVISFGNASGAVPPVNILNLGPKNVKLMRPVLNGYVAERKDLERFTKELFDLVIAKKVNIAAPAVYALKDAGRAHIDLESRKTTGKLLLKCD